jgi:oligopeptidase A
MGAVKLAALFGAFLTSGYSFLDAPAPIRWDRLTPARLERGLEAAIRLSRENLERVARLGLSEVSFRNCIEALERATEPLDIAWGRATHLSNVCSTEDFRRVYNRILEPVVRFYGGIALDGRLWERVKAFAETEEAERLEGLRKRLLEETLRDFREGGAELGEGEKERLREMDAQLARWTQKYAENLLDATERWEKYVEDLPGMPQAILPILRADAEAHGRTGSYRLTLHAPVYIPAMRHLLSEDLRRELWQAYHSLGAEEPYDNTEPVLQILRLRRERARLLGFENFADCVLARRMAGSGGEALGFVQDLHGRIFEKFLGDVAELERFRAEAEGEEVQRLQPWELAFWAEKQRQAVHGFDGERLRPYLELDAVLRGLFDLAQRLYGVGILERETRGFFRRKVPVWHGSVRYFEVRDGDGTPIGSFYLDLFPRKGKRSGAWMDDGFTPGHRDGKGRWILPVGMVAANLTPPTADQPSLLTHGEVETLYHEFGHLLHHLFGKNDYASLNGTNVAWDFVELPSQIMENWTWERDCLRSFARHWKTGQDLPGELFEKMSAARTQHASLEFMRQLYLAKLDLDLHMVYDGEPLDAFADVSIADYRIPYRTEQPNPVRHFGHLFSDPTGYAAAYYSYKWAEVLDADAFGRFQEEGIFNPETAGSFRREILERGNAEPPQRLFHNFRGREPQPEALLRRDGLLPPMGVKKGSAGRKK